MILKYIIDCRKNRKYNKLEKRYVSEKDSNVGDVFYEGKDEFEENNQIYMDCICYF